MPIPKDTWRKHAAGNDSTVYRLNSHIIKVYEFIDIETIKRYYEDTSKAAELMRKENSSITGFVGEFCKGHTLGIVVLEQGRIRAYDGKVVAVGQKFIDAHNLYDTDLLSIVDERFDNYRHSELVKDIEELRDGIQFGLNITKALIKRDVGRYFDIGDANVKIVPTGKHLDLIITDLATDIERTYR